MIYKVVYLNKTDTRLIELTQPLLKGWIHGGDWFGIELEDKLVAAACIDISKFSGIAYLYSGYVHEKHRGKGLHRLLIQCRCKFAFDKGCSNVRIKTQPNNVPCISNIRKEGFIPCRSDDDYLLTFTKNLEYEQYNESQSYSSNTLS